MQMRVFAVLVSAKICKTLEQLTYITTLEA
jgi:hypothetical protein